MRVLIAEDEKKGLPFISARPLGSPGSRWMKRTGDGASDHAEYLAATDPLNPIDTLLIELVLKNGAAAVGFSALAAQSYSVECKNDLAAGSWVTLQQVPAQSVTTLMQINDPEGVSSTARFYRVISPRQP